MRRQSHVAFALSIIMVTGGLVGAGPLSPPAQATGGPANLLYARPYSYTANPNGLNGDTTGTKLTDGIASASVQDSVQWNASGLGDPSVAITFDLGATHWTNDVRLTFARDDNGPGGPGPEQAVVATSTDGTEYNDAGLMRPDPANKDQSLNVLQWSHHGNVQARYLRITIDRSESRAGIMSLVEAEAFESSNAAASATYAWNAAPTGSWQDPAHSTLTDGTYGPGAQSDEWDAAMLPASGGFVAITFDLGTARSVDQVTSLWWRDEAMGRHAPDDVAVEGSLDATTWRRFGTATNATDMDATVNQFSWSGDPQHAYRYIRILAHRQLGSNAGTSADWTTRNPNAGIMALQEVCLFVAPQSAISPIADNLMRGRTYSLSPAPNGPNRDPGGRLTDGVADNSPGHAVEWDTTTLGSATVSLTSDLGSIQSIGEIDTIWERNQATGRTIPTQVTYEVSLTGTTWRTVPAREVTRQDGTASTWRWQAANDLLGRYVRVTATKTDGEKGIIGLSEVRVRDSVSVTGQTAGDVTTAYVMSIIAGSNVFFIPENKYPNLYDLPKPEALRDVVKAMHDNYGVNTLVVQYNGEVSRAQAMSYYRAWIDAGAANGVTIVPAIGLVQYDYVWLHPGDEYLDPSGNRYLYYGWAPMPDIRKAAVRDYFHDFLVELQLRFPAIRTVGTWDNNAYPLAKPKGFSPDDAQIIAWLDSLNSASPGKQHMIVFQQPGELNDPTQHPYLSRVDSVLLDTYGYVRDNDMTGLANYVTTCMRQYGTVIADLVPGNDDQDTVSPAINQANSANVIRAANAGLSLDVIINAANDGGSQLNRSDYWRDLLADGFYDGFLVKPWEEARHQFLSAIGDSAPRASLGTPAAATLVAPADQSVGASVTPTFQWSAGGEVDHYDLVVSERPDLAYPVVDAPGLVTSTYTPTTPLQPGRTYFWQVTAVGGPEWSGLTGSAVASFTTETISAPITSTNLALGRPYAKSVQPDPGYPDTLSDATDGFLASDDFHDGHSFAYRLASVGATITVDITVDLGANMDFRLARFHGISPALPTNYLPDTVSVSTSTDGVVYTPRGATQRADAQHNFDVSFTTTNARYVRFTLSKQRVDAPSDFLFIDELQVSNTGTASINIARGAAYVKSQSPAAAYPDPASTESTDGVIASDNYTDGKSFAFNLSTVGQSLTVAITVELAGVNMIDSARYHGIRPAGANYLPDNVAIATSTDGVNYTVRGSAAIASASGWMDVAFATTPARWVQFRITKTRHGATDDFLFVDELEVYRPGLTSDNVLLGASYTSPPSSTSYPDSGHELTDGRLGADNLADGLSVGWANGLNNSPSVVEITFDLGSVKNTGYYRSHAINPSGMNYLPDSMEVMVSTDGTSFVSVGATREVSGGWLTVSTGNNAARYLKFCFAKTKVNRFSDWLFLDELQAYGARPGTFWITSPKADSVYNPPGGMSTTPTITWSPSYGATTYSVTIADNRNLTEPVVNTHGITATVYTPTIHLQSGKTYFVRVTAHNPNGDTTDFIGILNTPHQFTTWSTNLSVGRSYTVSAPPIAGYPDTLGSESTDGIIASDNYADGRSYGYSLPTVGVPFTLTITVDLGISTSVNAFRLHGIQPAGANYLPDKVEVLTSNDNVSFAAQGKLVASGGWYDLGTSAVDARYIKFQVTKTRLGTTDDFLFIDEVEVYG